MHISGTYSNRLALFAPVVVVLALFIACKKDEPKPPPPPPAPPPPMEVEILDAERTCTKSSECTLITEDCCGCTSFGSQAGIRKDAVAAISARRQPICSAMSCPMGMSDHPSCAARIAVCKEGQCVPETQESATQRMKPTEIEPIGDVDAGPEPKALPPFQLKRH